MRVLDGTKPTDLRIARRLLSLAQVEPGSVAATRPIVVHRNHIEYSEFVHTRQEARVIDHRRVEFVTKRRVRRNPWPALAKEAHRG